MLPFAFALSYVSAVLPALRTHTPTRLDALSFGSVHVHLLLVDQSVLGYQALPSKTNHLYWYGLAPPVAVATKVTAVPTGCGAGRSAASAVSASGPPPTGIAGGVLTDPPVIGKEMLPFDWLLSYASAVLVELRTHTATR
jgi:hypothetical protein